MRTRYGSASGKAKSTIVNGRTGFILLVCVLIFISAAAFVLVRADAAVDGQSIVATINGEPVTFAVYKQHLEHNRARIYGYFKGKYDADADERFWTTNFDGEKPLDKIKRDSLNDLAQITVQRLLAKEKGLLTDIAYESFEESYAAENKRRAEATANNRIIYGPKQYSESAYYSYMNSDMIGKLKKALQQELVLSDDELKQYYEANKEKMFKRGDAVKIKKAAAVYGTDRLTEAEAEQTMRALQQHLDDGMELEEAAAVYPERIVIEEQLLDADSARSDALAYPLLTSAAHSLAARETSDIFRENGAYTIIQCVDRIGGDYEPFAKVKEAIRGNLAAEAYDRTVAELVRNADIVLNDEVYDRIGMDGI